MDTNQGIATLITGLFSINLCVFNYLSEIVKSINSSYFSRFNNFLKFLFKIYSFSLGFSLYITLK